ncbi:MAG: glycine dehydrogenase, partial [Aigarchaeota archaeon]|nr:glycine dehydrogenase [Aigarchaeota archaeon]
ALFVVGADLISLGVLRAPGNYGADIVVAEGQPLGNHVNFGGPLIGVLACKDDMNMIRAMPGRVIGMTKTVEGEERAFVMSLQTREQHIRRERATSNICTNQALCAVASAVYLSLLGKTGMRNLAEHILAKTRYASERLNSVEGVAAPLFNGVHFKEFTASFKRVSLDKVSAGLLSRGMHGGKDLRSEFPQIGESTLFCVTETHSKRQIDALVEAVAQIVGEH